MNHKKIGLLLILLTLVACSSRQNPPVAPTVGQPEAPQEPTLTPFVPASQEPTAVACGTEEREYVQYAGNLWASFREIYEEADLALRMMDANKFSELWVEATALFGDFAAHPPPASSLLIDYYRLESETFLSFTDAIDTGVGGNFVKATEMLAEVDSSYQTLHSMYVELERQCNIH
jgi:hypothetical protein